MNAIHQTQNRIVKGELGEVIEPLASYICAAEQPRKALLSVLTALVAEVEGTNRAAIAQFLHLRADSLGLAA